jgi:hypothetical protein
MINSATVTTQHDGPPSSVVLDLLLKKKRSYLDLWNPQQIDAYPMVPVSSWYDLKAAGYHNLI